MEGKIVTDIGLLVFFILMIAFRRSLFTKRFLKILKENWFVLGLAAVGIYMVAVPEESSPYQGYVFVIGALFVLYFFLFGYFKVDISMLRKRRGFKKKAQIIYFPLLSLFGIYAAYDYFTTQPYHILDIIIFVFFLGFVIYVSHFLLKETFFSKGRVNNNKPKL